MVNHSDFCTVTINGSNNHHDHFVLECGDTLVGGLASHLSRMSLFGVALFCINLFYKCCFVFVLQFCFLRIMFNCLFVCLYSDGCNSSRHE